jgi:uncharacterized protein (TIGR03437 family)
MEFAATPDGLVCYVQFTSPVKFGGGWTTTLKGGDSGAQAPGEIQFGWYITATSDNIAAGVWSGGAFVRNYICHPPELATGALSVILEPGQQNETVFIAPVTVKGCDERGLNCQLDPELATTVSGTLGYVYSARTPEPLRGLTPPVVEIVNVATPLLPPQISVGGIVNGADYSQPPFAPGTILSIFGTDLADATAGAGGLPLPINLAGTQVLVNGKAAPLFYVSRLQVNFQLPFEISGSSATIQVVPPQGSSDLVTVGLAALNAAGFTGPNGETVVSPTYKWATGKSLAGQTALVFGTGFGAVTPAVPSGMPAPRVPLSTLVKPVTISMCGQNAQVLWVGLAPDYVGLYQANIIVPSACAQVTDASVHIVAQ